MEIGMAERLRKGGRPFYGAPALEEHERPRLDALPRWRTRRRAGILERRMRREARTAVFRRVVHLEDDRLVAPHLWEVEPAVGGVVFQPVGLSHPIRVAPLRDQQVIRCYRPRIG